MAKTSTTRKPKKGAAKLITVTTHLNRTRRNRHRWKLTVSGDDIAIATEGLSDQPDDKFFDQMAKHFAEARIVYIVKGKKGKKRS